MAMHRDQHKVVDCSVIEQSAADNLATIVNGDGEHGIQVPVGASRKECGKIDTLAGGTGPEKGTLFRKILVISAAHDLAVVTDACCNSIGKLANCAENHGRAGAASPEYCTFGGEVGIMCVTNHVSGTIDGVTGEDDIGVNEVASRRGKRYWRARAGGPERGMAFNEVCVATVAEDVAGRIDAEGAAMRKLIAQLAKIDGRCLAVRPKHRFRPNALQILSTRASLRSRKSYACETKSGHAVKA